VRWVGFGMVLCSALLWAESGPDSETLVITNVNVVDTRYGAILPNMTVAIRDRVITAVAKIGIVEPGPQVRIMNGNGAYLAPGLWDMNAHLGETTAAKRKALFELYLASGVTGIRDLDNDRERAEDESGTLRPELEPAHPLWLQPKADTADGSLGPGRTIDDLSQISRACASRRVINQEPPGRVAEPLTLENSPACDPDTEHKLFLEISQHGTWVVPSLVSREVSSNKLFRHVGQAQSRSNLETSQQAADFEHASELVRDLHRAGVELLAGTNGPSATFLPWVPIQRELELLVESGLAPLEALQSATFNPALYMAKLNHYGVVEPAHIADLVLFEANPLADVRNTRKVVGIILRGQYFSRGKLDRMAADAENQVEPDLAAGHD
jgi:Amidohydrolase family